MGCKDCKVSFDFDQSFDFSQTVSELEEYVKDLEEIIPIILDAFEYWFYKNYDILLKAKSPYFRLLLQILRQQGELSSLFFEKFGKRGK